MGIVNVTADSFSDGGEYLHRERAVKRGLELRNLGVDIIDIGGESTRPGATRVDPGLEAERVVPVIRDLASEGVVVSVDTMRAEVAEAAINAGASIVNDVSGGQADPRMAHVVADAGVPWILMHWRSNGEFVHRASGGNDSGTRRDGYRDIVSEVSAELLSQVDYAVHAGVDPTALILDPGIGFAKTADENWALLRALPHLAGLGFPVLVGASRKRFLGSLLAAADGTPREVSERDVATAALSALAAAHGAWGVRVHDAQSTLDAVTVAQAWQQGAQP
ncbi:dihydropteroate synthase [Hoyosella rhizosphaerae]|uniref:Dihydropteroate synthase n=1 Tax=Hoyosella rhizosphaerae TaxID=1755582 RepID=A0A916UMG1_9ACTN|nr:dihydropteroate synthase [Hoyosella rhizosphaerae]MBN4925322.1 dihydropteroate synthase [Hoyosella rhizosphaerae]GGC76220.1 dihydropteroate synthase [Hoyosella rhizosphaerae]